MIAYMSYCCQTSTACVRQSGHGSEGVSQAVWLPALFSPTGTIRLRMIRLRRIRSGHCTVFTVDSYKLWSAALHSSSPGSSHFHIPKGLIPARRGFGIRGRFSVQAGTGGVAYEVSTRPHFLEGSHRFAKTSLGYEASEPPRGVAWVALIRTQTKRYVQRLFDSN